MFSILKNSIKIFKYLVVVLIFLYLIIWCSISLYVQKQINDSFSGKIFGNEKIVAVKFDNAAISGFPFEFAYKLENFREHNSTGIVKYQDPVRISFNFVKQNLYIEANGAKIIPGDFKITGNMLFSADFQYSNQFLSAIKNQNSFELINFFNNFCIYLSDTKIFLKDELLYNLTISDQKFYFKKFPYYKELDDFKLDLPKYIEITNKLRVASYNKKAEMPQSLSNPLNYNVDDYTEVDYDFAYNSHSKEKISLANFMQNAKLDGEFKFKHHYMSLGGYINYNSAIGDKNQVDIKTQITGKFTKEYKDKLSEEVMFALENLEELNQTQERLELINRFKKNFKNFIPDLEKFGQLELDINAKAEYDINNLKLNIDKFSLKNNLYEIFMHHDLLLRNDKIDHVNGVIALKQYNNLLNIAMDYTKMALNNLNPQKQHIKADDKYRSAIIKTIKSISNYPSSESQDLYFDISITKDSGKFGSVDNKSMSQKFYALFLKIVMAEAEANGIDVMEIIKKSNLGQSKN